jgi:hypothetical protein
MMIRMIKASALAMSALGFIAAAGCSAGDSGSSTEQSASELLPARTCASSTQCAKTEHCTTEDGVCNRPPGCGPNKLCPALCYGTCQPRPTEPQFCGGIAGFPCPEGQTCVDNPNDDCDPANGGADCGGICVSKPAFCGGIAAFPCPEGQTCVDDPSDDCDPKKGGADCGGICVKKPIKCTYTDPHRRYVAKTPSRCSVIRFFCAAGESYFSDSCGCGCVTAN